MASVIQKLKKKGLGMQPKWLAQNVQMECQTGSVSYGVSTDSSDFDVVGFAIPLKEDVFPHLRGEIMGFGRQLNRFDQYQEHHLFDKESGREYDVTIFSIVKFFQLCMENNPNMLDVLFVPTRCVLFQTKIGQLVRENREIFLHKGSFHKFKGYAYAQLHKLEIGSNKANPKRQETVAKYGYDTKWAYHVVRLALECEQILTEHTLDIQRNSEMLKSIRRGEWTLEYLREWFNEKEKHLENLYNTSTLQMKPDEERIKRLLVECLEHHYGSLTEAVSLDVNVDAVLRDMQDVIDRYRVKA